MVEEKQKRAQRSDKGTVRLSERDIAVFNWLADMKAMYEADLRILLGRLSDGRIPSESAVRQVVGRWQRAGYGRAQKLLVGQPRIIWLLPAGATIVGEATWKETAAHTSLHQAEVAHVRLWLEGRTNPTGPVTSWESERRIRQWYATTFKDGSRGAHVPDAFVTFANDLRAPVEVERTEKQRERLTKIVEGLMTANKLTLYAVAADARNGDALCRQILTAYEDVKAGRNVLANGRVQIMRYPRELEA